MQLMVFLRLCTFRTAEGLQTELVGIRTSTRIHGDDAKRRGVRLDNKHFASFRAVPEYSRYSYMKRNSESVFIHPPGLRRSGAVGYTVSQKRVTQQDDEPPGRFSQFRDISVDGRGSVSCSPIACADPRSGNSSLLPNVLQSLSRLGKPLSARAHLLYCAVSSLGVPA